MPFCTLWHLSHVYLSFSLKQAWMPYPLTWSPYSPQSITTETHDAPFLSAWLGLVCKTVTIRLGYKNSRKKMEKTKDTIGPLQLHDYKFVILFYIFLFSWPQTLPWAITLSYLDSLNYKLWFNSIVLNIVNMHYQSKVLEHHNFSSFLLKFMQCNVSLHSEMKAF